MRDLVVILLSIGILILSIGHCLQEIRIRNLEQTIKHVEQGYNAVLAENRKMERMCEQNLRLMTEGGWDGTISMGASY